MLLLSAYGFTVETCEINLTCFISKNIFLWTVKKNNFVHESKKFIIFFIIAFTYGITFIMPLFEFLVKNMFIQAKFYIKSRNEMCIFSFYKYVKIIICGGNENLSICMKFQYLIDRKE